MAAHCTGLREVRTECSCIAQINLGIQQLIGSHPWRLKRTRAPISNTYHRHYFVHNSSPVTKAVICVQHYQHVTAQPRKCIFIFPLPLLVAIIPTVRGAGRALLRPHT